jgi:hypothetical protein
MIPDDEKRLGVGAICEPCGADGGRLQCEAVAQWPALMRILPTRNGSDRTMSLAIRTGEVTAVLLADGCHDVIGGTLGLDAYEYVDRDHVAHGGGQGFGFIAADDEILYGPLTAILAVATKPQGASE